MRSSLRPSALPGVVKNQFPPQKARDVIIPEPEDGSTPEAAYLTAVRRLHRDECLVLPPGDYPAPKLTKTMSIRAARPGTVRFHGPTKGATLLLQTDHSVLLSGIQIISGNTESPTIQQSNGCLILSEVRVVGGLESSGTNTRLFLENSRVERAEVGVLLTEGAKGEIVGTAVTNCQVGVSAQNANALHLLSCRVEGAFRDEEGNPGAGLHADNTPVYCAGTVFMENQIGAHFVSCKEVKMLFCEFDRQILGGVTMQNGGPLHLHECAFSAQATKTFAHVTIDSVTASVDFCLFDNSADGEIQSLQGNLTRRDETPKPADTHSDVLSSVLAEIHQMIGMNASKKILETLLHQAYASVQRKKQGLPVPPLKFHCVFESEEGSGCRQVAALLAKSLGTLGILKDGGKVMDAEMALLMDDPETMAALVESARGGMLFLSAPAHSERKNSRISYAKIRAVLQSLLDACAEDTVVIFSGPRDSIRPIVRSVAETEELFRAALTFSLPSPPELAEMFDTMAADLHIRLTTKAKIKILLSLHMLDDRRDRRFLTTSGVAKLLDATQKRYFERCSRERSFDLPLEAGDIDVPVEKLAEVELQAHPVFLTICPKCKAENPWVPGQPHDIRCADCETLWESGWGAWKGSAYFRRLNTDEEMIVPVGLPAHRGRAAISG